MSENQTDDQKKPTDNKPKRGHSVMTYMVILFIAALFLLVMAYCMQHRSSLQAINSLQESVSTVQNVQEIYEENVSLKEQINLLEDQLDDLVREAADSEKKAADLEEQAQTLTQTAQAMDWFWQIDEAYVLGRYTLAQQLLDSMDAAGLTEFLPHESVTSNNRFSPYDRCLEIRSAIGAQ